MSAVPSPCQKVCSYDGERGWCTGCGRTLSEIGEWIEANDDTRRAIIAQARSRLSVGHLIPAKAAIARD